MKSVLRGPLRNALKFALEEASSAHQPHCVRGWKLLILLPQMLLHRRPGGRVVSKPKLVERFEMFERGQWHQLIRASEDCDERSAVARRRRTRRETTLKFVLQGPKLLFKSGIQQRQREGTGSITCQHSTSAHALQHEKRLKGFSLGNPRTQLPSIVTLRILHLN